MTFKVKKSATWLEYNYLETNGFNSFKAGRIFELGKLWIELSVYSAFKIFISIERDYLYW
jgi:hypothetical protein